MISCARLPDMRADNDLLSEPGRALTDEDHELCDSLDQPEPAEIHAIRLAWEDAEDLAA
jgi:hypothetical protein